MGNNLDRNFTEAAGGSDNPTPDTTSQYDQQLNPEPIELDWNEERAKAWHEMQPPSKPSDSEIAIYKKYFEKKTRFTRTPKVLILGSTVEFRKLAFDLKCAVTVVDYSKKYHDIISEDLKDQKDEILKEERLIECEWSEMIDNPEKKTPLDDEEESFDIIIGDLAIGNIPPQKLDRFFKNVSKLLNKDGYFLGKSIYTYSDFKTDKIEISKKLKELVDNKTTDKSIVYAKTMYDLSVFNADFTDKARKTRKINFKNLHAQIAEFVGDDKLRKKIFNIYLGGDTNFEYKMPQNFYIYEYSQILDLINRYNFEILDVEYGNDSYNDKYPLLILKKGNSEYDNPISIQAFISKNERYLEEWQKNISSRFFLINLDQVDEARDRCIKIEDVRNRIKNLFNRPAKKDYPQTVEVDDDLNFAITSIEDEAINRETEALVKGREIENDHAQKEKLKKHFIYGIFFNEAYVVNKVKQNTHDNDIEKLILSELFKDPIETNPGHLWAPYDSPWVAAKICICLLPLYRQYERDKKSSIIHPYLKRLENVVATIANTSKFNSADCMWDTKIGSRFDTTSLCLEVLHGYYNCLKRKGNDKNDKRELDPKELNSKIDNVLDRYVLNGRIYETFIKYPIYSSLIEQVCANSYINDKPAYKKMCGRIEWYTILYTICKDKERAPFNRGDTDKYIVAAKYIAAQLKKFWLYFNQNIDDIYEQTKEQEISLIPQIVYCISHSKVLEDR